MKYPVEMSENQLSRYRVTLADLPVPPYGPNQLLFDSSISYPGVSETFNPQLGVNNRPVCKQGTRKVFFYTEIPWKEIIIGIVVTTLIHVCLIALCCTWVQ